MGEVFAGRYELVDPVGRGGVGAVWRAWDHRRRRYVAAKVLQQRDAHALLRFVREQALRIDHPHVLAPTSWAADDDKVLFTMDLVRGGSFAHLVGDYGPVPPRLVCVLLDQLLAGLSAVHAEGVVHRDIKPANVLLEATGTGTPHVRLSDFGIAMRKGDARLTEADFVVGTPGYFAPEQLLGAEPDFPADLYAVGLVALYLLVGQRPDADALQQRFLASGMPPAPEGVPAPLWQVVGALLQPDPYARFRTATGARKALATAVELLPEPAAGRPEEVLEIPDRIGPLPDGYGPAGPLPADRAGDGGTGASRTFPLGGIPAARQPLLSPAPQPAVPEPGAPGKAPAEDPRAAMAPGPLTHTRTRLDPPDRAPGLPPAAPGLPSEPPSPGAASGARPAASPGAVPAAFPGVLPQPDTASAPQPVRRPRPGPPPKVAVPLLVLALLCFAVGLAALAAS